eukprot:3304738-Rhodomonas_salina.1
MHKLMCDGRDEYDEYMAEMEAQGILLPPSALSLSSMNMFKHVEANTTKRFEKAVLAMTPEEQLDCRTLFFRGGAMDVELSDLPFLSSSSTYADHALNHLSTPADSTIPIFSLNSSHVPPISTLPTSLVLSIPQYLNCIDDTLTSYNPTLRSHFQALLTCYALDVFPDPPKLKLGQRRPEDLRINGGPGSTPVWKKVYRLSPPQISELKQQLTKMIKAGIIQPSNSPYSAPVLFAPKKDWGLRLCIDYSVLNAQTVKDRFPIPHAEDLFDTLCGSKVFSKLDLFSGFWQIRVDPDSIHKTAFRTPFGQYKWLSMPMGLSNSPSVFQRLVSRILGNLDFVEVFMDDILIHSPDHTSHLAHIETILKILQDNSLTAKLTKCEFFAQSVECLGHIVSADGISMEPSKTKAFTDWPIP